MEINKIYCGDAGELLEALEPESIDLTVTSPPYDGLRKYNGYIFDFERIARGLYRATKAGRVVVWVVSDQTIKGSETGTSFRQALYFMELGFNLHDTMIYKFAGTGAKGSILSYWQGFEYMFVLSKGKPNTINRIKDHKNVRAGSKRGHVGKYANGTRSERGVRIAPEYSVRDNVWFYGGSVGEKTKHPAQFPEALARDHIISWSNPGDLVLDPMCGSGTTLKMAETLDRRWIGFDVSAEYCELARRRATSANIPFPGFIEKEI